MNFIKIRSSINHTYPISTRSRIYYSSKLIYFCYCRSLIRSISPIFKCFILFSRDTTTAFPSQIIQLNIPTITGKVNQLIAKLCVVLVGDSLLDGITQYIRVKSPIQVEVIDYLVDLVGSQYLVGDDCPVPSDRTKIASIITVIIRISLNAKITIDYGVSIVAVRRIIILIT